MGEASENKPVKHKKHICIGILAHVDAGKTTLSEAMLYKSGSIRTLGRVDKGDAFLDTDQMEKQRGITIFSKQAQFALGNLQVTLLDTPGHVDFSAEAERVLQVLDYAILVISGADGVQGHTQTLWRLLEKHRIPTFLFVNKMDQQGTDADMLQVQLEKRLSGGCIRFGKGYEDTDAFFDSAAMCSEALMEAYLEQGMLTREQLADGICRREIFPCYFGSALKLTGVEEFLAGLATYLICPQYGDKFGARVFKIARDAQGNRLTYLKIVGGKLKVREVISGGAEVPEETATETAGDLETAGNRPQSDTVASAKKPSADWQEKVTQIRIYSGVKFEAVDEAGAGMVCAVTGLSYTKPGMGLGCAHGVEKPLLIPVLTYRILLPPDVDTAVFLPKLRLLEEEEPLLSVVFDDKSGDIHVQVMGEVQIEILQQQIKDRFGVEVTFGEGTILYRETIADMVIGVGHFEPLRHYAEVHLQLSPGEEGSGLVFDSACSEDVLARNWQRLILTHLAERTHRGVLTGSPITDMKITLIAGRAHPKHTEGGDFRQATYRAVRQGLMEAQSVLLEPYYAFRLEVPERFVGRAMTDLERMDAQFTLRQMETDAAGEEGMAVLTGTVPVSTVANYQKDVISYTSGRGRLSCSYYGYRRCHNSEEVCAAAGYDPEQDLRNPPGSIFCAHGAGFYVPWDEVKAHKHVLSEEEKHLAQKARERQASESGGGTQGGVWLSPDEVDKIVAQAGSANKRAHIDTTKRWGQRYTNIHAAGKRPASETTGASAQKVQAPKERYLLVDGYNIIFAWDELKALAADNIDGARGKLMDILSNYQAFADCHLMLVFDAYRVKGHPTEVTDYHNIRVVYTKEAETADQYIEQFAHKNARLYDISVATSDGLEQIIIRSQGCRLLSAKDFYEEVSRVSARIRETYENYLKRSSFT